MKDNLGTLIQDVYQLIFLLDCEQLNEAQCTVIWKAVEGRLGALIQDGRQLSELLNCEQLTDARRTAILDVLKDNLGTLIQDGRQLSRLLNCKQLNEAHRTTILVSLEPSFLEKHAGSCKLPQTINIPQDLKTIACLSSCHPI